MDDPITQGAITMKRSDRYRKVAGEYYDLARAAPSPYLRDYFQRAAEKYRLLAQGEMRVLECEGASIVECSRQ